MTNSIHDSQIEINDSEFFSMEGASIIFPNSNSVGEVMETLRAEPGRRFAVVSGEGETDILSGTISGREISGLLRHDSDSRCKFFRHPDGTLRIASSENSAYGFGKHRPDNHGMHELVNLYEIVPLRKVTLRFSYMQEDREGIILSAACNAKTSPNAMFELTVLVVNPGSEAKMSYITTVRSCNVHAVGALAVLS